MSSISKNLETIFYQIEQSAHRAQRETSQIRLLAASKGRTPDEMQEVIEAGVTLFGENRVQEARQKIPLCSSRAKWHFIGHLQTNKVRDAVALFSLIQSIDSFHLAKALSEEADKQGRDLDILVEVNVSGEKSKFGVDPNNLFPLLEVLNTLPRLRLCGLMTLAPWVEEAQKARPYFAALRECRDRAEAKLGLKLPELSMGMSHDFVSAIEEGSTIVRIGTAIFGKRNTR